MAALTIEELAARQAITDRLYSYCRAMDRIDHELGYAVWHEGGAADYGALFQGTGRGFIDWVCETHRGLLSHAHELSNILIRVEGDRAVSEAYINATLRFSQDDQLKQAEVHGRYLDTWSRRDGRWAIDRRVYVQDFDDVRDVTTALVGGWGKRDPQDPSYAVLGQSLN